MDTTEWGDVDDVELQGMRSHELRGQAPMPQQGMRGEEGGAGRLAESRAKCSLGLGSRRKRSGSSHGSGSRKAMGLLAMWLFQLWVPYGMPQVQHSEAQWGREEY